MPGKPFQSSLEPHLETIRALRLKRRTWRQVAAALKAEHSLEIDPAAVYKFFKRRVHPSTRQPLGFPAVAATESAQTVGGNSGETPPAAPEPPAGKKWVFNPDPKPPARFADEDLEFNDPFGKAPLNLFPKKKS